MIKKYRYPVFMLLPICIMAYTACTQQKDPCLTPKTAGLNMQFVHIVTDSVTADTVLPAAVFIAITSSGKDLVIDSSYNSAFTISLSPVANTCKYMVATDTARGSLFDTLTFFYQRDLQFLSNACGYTYFYSLDSVHNSHIFIDSVVILNGSVTNNVNTEHLKVYIHPD